MRALRCSFSKRGLLREIEPVSDVVQIIIAIGGH